MEKRNAICRTHIGEINEKEKKLFESCSILVFIFQQSFFPLVLTFIQDLFHFQLQFKVRQRHLRVRASQPPMPVVMDFILHFKNGYFWRVLSVLNHVCPSA
uniref:(northern house mosquito) hypothetical protein n=1 Tax=Culex pipiens TaxID=7175 RepID=A0A8D8CWX0_CULPI